MVPLGVLAMNVTNSNGPDRGATSYLKSTQCAYNEYALQTVGPDGLSRTEVPFGSYTITLTNSSTGAQKSYPVVVGAGTVSINSATTALPSIAPVAGP